MEGPNELADYIRRMRRADYDSDSSTDNDDFDYETLRDKLPLNRFSMQTIRRNDNDLKTVTAFWDDEDDALLDANGVNWATCGSDFGTNDVLKELIIDSFREDPESRSSNFVCFCEALARNRSIEVLAITGCVFDSEWTARALKALAPFFQCNSNLRHVEMARCTIDFSNMTQLEHLRCKNNSLDHICFENNRCPPLAKQRMLEALAEQRFLKRIILSGTTVGWGAMLALAKVLSAPTSKVDTLILRSTSMDDEEISFFLKTVANNKQLRALSLEGLALGALGCRSLSKYLRQNSCALEGLDLSGCNLTDAYFILLEKALAENTSLLSLNLANNDTISAVAWREFKFWSYTAIPKRIGLGGNQIPRDFVQEFATSNVALESISLSRTESMSTTEIRMISDYLRSSGCALKELYLSANDGVNDVGATMLCSALAHNTCLAILDLCGNPIHNWGIFCGRLLCDTSSPSRTHASNHTLESLGPLGYFVTRPSRLIDLLQLNRDCDKTAVARSKILRTHLLRREHADGDNIHLLCNMDVKLLPRVLAWLGYARDDDGFALTYQLLARLPELLSRQNPGMKKRKRA